MRLIDRLSRWWFPTLALLVSAGLWVALYGFPSVWKVWLPSNMPYEVVRNALNSLLLISIYAAVVSPVNITGRILALRYQKHAIWSRVISLTRAFKVLVLLAILHQGMSTFNIPLGWEYRACQCIRAVMVAILGWCLSQLLQVGETLLLQQLPGNSQDSIGTRRRYTHIRMITRILTLLLGVITLAMMLVTFSRSTGNTILASAGVLTTIVGFSARGLLDSLFKGVQLAIAQPVRLEDTISINGEIGTVTSITLQHAVITLNDHSQLIVPINDLLDKTFKNWTHSSNDLIGNVIFYVKYDMPIERIRKMFNQYLEVSEYWDKGVGELQVSDLKANLVEVKLIISAKTGRALSKLRNELLEKMLEYMQRNYPDGLP